MASRHTFNRIVGMLTAAIFALAMSSCATVYELYAPPGANVNPPIAGNYENPDKYRVAESERKTYVAIKTFNPPPPQRGASISNGPLSTIEVGDIWTVTHRVESRLVIFSQQYQARQERASPRQSNYLYHLYIDPDGRINKGWLLLRDPKYVVLASERMTVMDPSIRDTDGWPDEPVFLLQK